MRNISLRCVLCIQALAENSELLRDENSQYNTEQFLGTVLSDLNGLDDFAYFSIQKVSAEKICEKNGIKVLL